MPYITASIILQLLTVVYEPLAKLQKEGEMGRKENHTVDALSHGGFGARCSHSASPSACRKRAIFVTTPGPGFILMTMLTLTTGSAFHHVAGGSRFTERGIGNGMSLLIFAGIVVGLAARRPSICTRRCKPMPGEYSRLRLSLMLLALMIGGGRIHRICGTQRAADFRCSTPSAWWDEKVMGGPIDAPATWRVNAGGVMPVIFRVFDFWLCRKMLGAAFHNNKVVGPILDWLKWGEPLYTLLYCLGIVFFFAYFYISIVFKSERGSLTICGSGEVLFPASGPGSGLRISSMTF